MMSVVRVCESEGARERKHGCERQCYKSHNNLVLRSRKNSTSQLVERRKKPRFSRGFLSYRPVPEPGPVGVTVEPLGEEPAPIVLPDGFVVDPAPLAEPAVLPVELPAPLIVVPLEPPVPAPALLPLDPAAEPPAAPPAPPPACASANVLERAKAVANAIVVILMVVPLGCCSDNNDNLHLMFLHQGPIGSKAKADD
jgi:hypothetical protein